MKCPKCKSYDVQQQLNLYYFNCLNCHKWFKLKPVSFEGGI